MATAAAPRIAPVTYGFMPADDELDTPRGTTGGSKPGTGGSRRTPRHKLGDYNVGLGTGSGGTLVRSCLVNTGAGIMEHRMRRALDAGHVGAQAIGPHDRKEALPLSENLLPARGAPMGRGMVGDEPHGLVMCLILNDKAPADKEVLAYIAAHRWSFKGALDLAKQTRAFSCLVWCLLELQANVQTDEESSAFDPRLVKACSAFVSTQCRLGKVGEMYQVLTHFLCNSLVFHEWDTYLKIPLESPSANRESFLVPYLEQVWFRFQKLFAALEGMFGCLDDRFVWKHGLPKVGDLLYEHMRRRCFSSELIVRNELFQGATIRDETMKSVKFTFGFN